MIPFAFEKALHYFTADFVSFIAFELAFFIVMGVFIWFGSHVAQIKKNRFPKAVVIAFFSIVISSILVLPFSDNVLLVVGVSLIVSIIVIKLAYSTNWRQALVAWTFSAIALFLVLLFVLQL